MSVLPKDMTVLHDDSNAGDSMHVQIARADMLMMGRRWPDARPIDVSSLPERRTNGVYRPLAGVRIEHLVVTLERHDEDGRMLCVTPERGGHYRLILPPEVHPIRDHPHPDIELNALMRLWGGMPDRMTAWRPTEGGDRWSDAALRMTAMLGAVATTSTPDDGERTLTLLLASPWAPVGAACFGDLRGILLWRDDVLRLVAERADLGVCTALDVFYRQEGMDHGSTSASVPTPYLMLRSASMTTPLLRTRPVETLRLLAELGTPDDGPMTSSFHIDRLGSDPRFVEPVIIGSWRN